MCGTYYVYLSSLRVIGKNVMIDYTLELDHVWFPFGHLSFRNLTIDLNFS